MKEISQETFAGDPEEPWEVSVRLERVCGGETHNYNTVRSMFDRSGCPVPDELSLFQVQILLL